MEPVTRQMAAKVAPAGAIALPATDASGWRQTNWLMDATAIPAYPAIPSQAAGT